MAASPPFANSSFEHNVLAQHLLDHAPFHGADSGVLLHDIEIGASEQPEAIAGRLNFYRNAAALQRSAQRRQALVDTFAGDLAAILLGEPRADGVEQPL